MGGKFRMRKKISQIVGKVNVYIEPFVGGGSVISEVEANIKYGYDINKYLIHLHNHVKDHKYLPDNITEDEYHYYKNLFNNKEYKNDEEIAMIAFIGFGCSFAGKFFGGYAKNNTGKNYCKLSKNSLLRRNYHNVIFENKSYHDVDIIEGSTVYCDPPYRNTTGYNDTAFDSDQFWKWAEEKSKMARVIVSEYNAPKHWKVIYEQEQKTTVNSGISGKSKNAIEKIFELK
jgi:DNA adenine methylase